MANKFSRQSDLLRFVRKSEAKIVKKSNFLIGLAGILCLVCVFLARNAILSPICVASFLEIEHALALAQDEISLTASSLDDSVDAAQVTSSVDSSFPTETPSSVDSLLPTETPSPIDLSLFDAESFEGDVKPQQFCPEQTTEGSDLSFFPMAKESSNTRKELTVNESAWAKFQPGSRIRTRTVGTTFQDGKRLRSVTEKKFVLMEVDADGYVLQCETSVLMGNQFHVTEPKLIRFDFFDMPVDVKSTIIVLPATNLMIARKVIPCEVCQIDRSTPQFRERSKYWFSPVVSPYLLQKETRIYSLITENNPEEQLLSWSQTNVLKTSAHMIFGTPLLAYRSQTICQKGESTTVTQTYHSTKIPGGVVRSISTETDPAGNLLYQSTTVLLDYFTPLF